MKLTEKQIRRIIQEEILRENKKSTVSRNDIVALVQEVLVEEHDAAQEVKTTDGPGRNLGYNEGEGRMTKSHLFQIAEYAAELHEMLQDGDDLPEWVSAKISVMANNIDKIKHYLEYKILRMQSP